MNNTIEVFESSSTVNITTALANIKNTSSNSSIGSHTAISSKRGVFMLGMHRSGTSLITGILVHIGLKMGNNLIGTTIDNAKGYFESYDVISINDDLMKIQNVSFDNRVSNFSNTKAYRDSRSRKCKYMKIYIINRIV